MVSHINRASRSGVYEGMRPSTKIKIMKHIVNAICQLGFTSMDHACDMEKLGLAVFTGNQWNENWSWKAEALEKLEEEHLIALYQIACEGRPDKLADISPCYAIFHGEGGYPWEREKAKATFRVGGQYRVIGGTEGQSLTSLEIEDRGSWNSVLFHYDREIAPIKSGYA